MCRVTKEVSSPEADKTMVTSAEEKNRRMSRNQRTMLVALLPKKSLGLAGGDMRIKRRKKIQFTTHEISQTKAPRMVVFGVLCLRSWYIYRERNLPPFR